MDQILLVSSFALWILVILNFLLILGLARRLNAALPQRKRLKPGQQAPNFAAPTLDGQTLQLTDFSGRALALIFFSPDCSTCGEILTGIKQLKSTAEQAGTELVLVGDHEADSLRAYTKDLKIDLPVITAPRRQNPLLIDYRVLGVPWFCIVDEHGQVRADDFASFEDIEKGLSNFRKKGVMIEEN